MPQDVVAAGLGVGGASACALSMGTAPVSQFRMFWGISSAIFTIIPASRADV